MKNKELLNEIHNLFAEQFELIPSNCKLNDYEKGIYYTLIELEEKIVSLFKQQ